jgi:hypothetical protein
MFVTEIPPAGFESNKRTPELRFAALVGASEGATPLVKHAQ